MAMERALTTVNSAARTSYLKVMLQVFHCNTVTVESSGATVITQQTADKRLPDTPYTKMTNNTGDQHHLQNPAKACRAVFSIKDHDFVHSVRT